jgi:hypothetical protein
MASGRAKHLETLVDVPIKILNFKKDSFKKKVLKNFLEILILRFSGNSMQDVGTDYLAKRETTSNK